MYLKLCSHKCEFCHQTRLQNSEMCAHHPLFILQVCLYKLGLYLVLHQKRHQQKVKGDDSSPLLHPHESPPGLLPPGLEPQHKKDTNLLQQVQRRPQKCLKHWYRNVDMTSSVSAPRSRISQRLIHYKKSKVAQVSLCERIQPSHDIFLFTLFFESIYVGQTILSIVVPLHTTLGKILLNTSNLHNGL